MGICHRFHVDRMEGKVRKFFQNQNSSFSKFSLIVHVSSVSIEDRIPAEYAACLICFAQLDLVAFEKCSVRGASLLRSNQYHETFFAFSCALKMAYGLTLQQAFCGRKNSHFALVYVEDLAWTNAFRLLIGRHWKFDLGC